MLRLYKANETNFKNNGLGILKDAVEAKVTEELNGLFELEFTYYVGSFLFDEIDYNKIVMADASPRLKNQLFRIYYISKELDGKILVKAEHISYDLLNNFIENLELKNITCKEALNQIFRACTEENRFVGYSDITGNKDFSISCVSPHNAISDIQELFNNKSKLKRDNFNISLLNHIGESNNVLLAYRKNITGLTATYDTQEVITKIYPYAIKKSGKNKKITLPEKYIESKYINNYPTQRIVAVDFSDDDVKNEESLRNKCKDYFIENNVDLPKVTYKVEFIDLSTTEDYKSYKMLETVNMDDEIIVRDYNLGINATARVVKTEYNPVLKKYNSVEIGDLVNHFKDERIDDLEEKIDKVQNNVDNIVIESDNFPDTLPEPSNVTALGLWSMIQLDWTFDNKLYYNYEVYASQIKGFEPDTAGYTNRIYVGQASSLLHEVKPMQTWYYRVRAGNTHDNYNEFSNEVSATTRKLSDAAEYFEEAAIGHAVIRDLDADKINVGKVKGQYIEAKNLVVVDGNSKTTLNIDSFGNVHIGATTFTLKGKSLESIIGGEIDDITQFEIFNKLTNNGLTKGLYMVGNELYLNASYIRTGTLEGKFINGRNLTIRDNDGYITLQVDSNGKVNIRANELSIGSKNNYESVLTSDQQAVFDALTGNRNCGIYLSGSRLYINADYIDTGTILCDRIGASSSNPRILLFSGNGAECAIDATALNGVGIGKSIRFQYNRSHYVAVTGSSINFYIGSTTIYNNFSPLSAYFYQDDITWDSAQFDMSGALRLYTKSGETGFVAWNDGVAAIYTRGIERHAFYDDGSKKGGSIEIDGTIFGMSPVDSPQTLIEDILFDVEVEEAGTIVKLDSTYAKTISRYAVFPSNGKVEVVEKQNGYFKVCGYTGKVDFSVKGSRIDKEHEYFSIMGGEEQHGNF
ncbi:phage tail spike protein [Clostridioides difficile]|uniref:phage tail spike protein n=1 Tax=Clostridioides difficile TaxID=1496 RepID=UPI0009800F00|nr:phage tail spike protein [Clostridioides difficile]SJP04636.1 Phage-related protein [Clostridioides difficile]HBF4252774.1 phage tail protein [Clostridioides difficile]HBF5909138.1 phage tail protein [Clostridioides difficile]HBF6289599.1 phage tail protein [Clostridioides difficile]HBY2688412.1 phage tail protein [Clostridioides difficile]